MANQVKLVLRETLVAMVYLEQLDHLVFLAKMVFQGWMGPQETQVTQDSQDKKEKTGSLDYLVLKVNLVGMDLTVFLEPKEILVNLVESVKMEGLDFLEAKEMRDSQDSQELKVHLVAPDSVDFLERMVFQVLMVTREQLGAVSKKVAQTVLLAKQETREIEDHKE